MQVNPSCAVLAQSLLFSGAPLQTKGFFGSGKAASLSSKMLIGPKMLESAYRSGIAKGIFGPYWCAPRRGAACY